MTITLVLLLCLVGAPCKLCVVLHAPAPLYRPLPPAPIVGTWVLHWSGCEGRATFHPDGTCTTYGGWEGRWKWDARRRVLTVDEGLSLWTRIRWSAQLDGNLSGAMVPVGPGGPYKVSLRKRE